MKSGIAIFTLFFLAACSVALAQQPGVTPTEIKIGQTTSYSGPASQYGEIGKVEAAYFRLLNDHGGINGRKISFVSQDDGYSPAKSVEQMRKLVEDDGVAFMFNSFGGPTNAAQAKYLNKRGIPQLFVGTGAHYWGDAKDYPWSMGWQPSFRTEARIYATDAITRNPNVKFAILYQNDDFGKDYVLGIKDVLKTDSTAKIVSELSYETSDTTVDSQTIEIASSQADVLILAAIPKFAAQALRKIIQLNWHGAIYVTLGASGVPATVEPVIGHDDLNLYTGAFFKDWNNLDWKKDPALKDFFAFMEKYEPGVAVNDFAPVYGYSLAATLVDVLRRCGDDLSRANIMKQASSISHLHLPLLIPGIEINTSPTDHYPIEQLQLAKWSGKAWVLEGAIISTE